MRSRMTRARLTKLILPASLAAVTRGVGDDPRLPQDLDDQCRRAADDFIGRRGEEVAHFSGLAARTVNEQRERLTNRRAALHTVAALVGGGLRAGFDFDRCARYLAPVLDRIDADLVQRASVSGGAGVVATVPAAVRAVGEAIASAIDSARDGRISRHELARLEPQIDQAITELHRLRREAQVAAGRKPA